ncbi:RusA family crossover junction endodeoxyribonuclease [Leuconostoc mesenteroides]|uniref:RusA family crossover junction endodeoxyribonuclease n=1 Tax=Leuconostoc mesenteroides TaxID=1245 RepID=UPI00235F8BEB|nr:RusA family crossover junction endodeoxyribonuclease [Leuconostoc mesenteroides]
MFKTTVLGHPRGATRMRQATRGGKSWSYTDPDYMDFLVKVAEHCNQYIDDPEFIKFFNADRRKPKRGQPQTYAISMKLRFFIKSTAKELPSFFTAKPDLDNLIKGAQDGMWYNKLNIEPSGDIEIVNYTDKNGNSHRTFVETPRSFNVPDSVVAHYDAMKLPVSTSEEERVEITLYDLTDKKDVQALTERRS